MKDKMFKIVLVRYENTEDEDDADSVVLKEWKLTYIEALKLFLCYAEAHPDTRPDSGDFDSIMFSEAGIVYGLFVTK